MFNDMTDKKIQDENESRSTRSIPRKFLVVCLVGLILFAGGLILATGSQLLKDNSYNYGYYSDHHSTGDSRFVRTVGVILAELGILVSVSGFLSAAFLTSGLDRQTRVALLGSSFGLTFIMVIFALIFGLT